MNGQISQSDRCPEFSVLMAVYNVEEYITGSFRSLLKQSYPFRDLEIIIVDDGSEDQSGRSAREFANKHANVKYLWQENGGPGAARSEALKHATGKWVTVVDPDDLLHEDYFSSISDFIKRDKNSSSDLLISNIILMNGTTASLSDKHPLNFRFKGGEQLVSLYDHPNCIQLGATAFLRRSFLLEHGLSYDPRIEPTFEDGHLLGRYLARTENAIVGIVPDAKYFYRKRADQSSLVQSGWNSQDRYTTVLELGYLDMLRDIRNTLGYVPKWAQNMVLYDLMWYFKEDARLGGRTTAISLETRPDFLSLLDRIFGHIDEETITGFNLHPAWWTLKMAILARYKGTFDNEDALYQWGSDSKDGGNSYSLIFRNEEPQQDIFLNGIRHKEFKQNYVNYSFFGQYFMTEKSIKVTKSGHVRILVNGLKPKILRVKKSPPLEIGKSKLNGKLLPKRSEESITQRIIRSIPRLPSERKAQLFKFVDKVQLATTRVSVGKMALDKNTVQVLIGAYNRKIENNKRSEDEMEREKHMQMLQEQALVPSVRSKFQNAWIILDRPTQADDNGEHFYRYLLENKPEVNAWFLLDAESPDWIRLEREGFRLLPYGSDSAFLACSNAQCIISSDAVEEVMYPAGKRYISYEKSKFFFLQHGVIKDDLSKWLNGKNIDAIVTTTSQEYESFVGSSSPYKFESEQVILTGLPRYDMLLELRAAKTRRFITVMPTWRMNLRDELKSLVSPEERREHIRSSLFGTSWHEYLNSPELKAIADQQNLEILYVAHPSLKPYVTDMDLPSYISTSDDSRLTFQEIIAESALYVTDYSSVAFDAAMIDVPVVYYQFDKDSFFSGHSYSPGYFDYEKDGFGPVATTSMEAIEATRIQFSESSDEEMYDARRRHTFLYRDGKNCERVYKEIVRRNS